jgi:predicted TIM-barrel fold metal-dependent hydrolase
MTGAARIDTHQHLIPPFYRKLLDDRGLTAGGWPTPKWDPETAIAVMDEESIAVGVLSLSAPGTQLTNDPTVGRDLAREVNDYGAELSTSYPDRFGHFASLSLPDVDGAIDEVIYAMDVLHADGVVILSNAGGVYLGDARYEPLWAELDARSAVVFVHPTAPVMDQIPGMPGPLLDYPFDTTRTAVHMVYNGVLSRYPRMKIILSHAGGFLPYAAYRFMGGAQFNPGLTTDSILTDLRRFYFDTALSASPSSLPSLLAFADPTHITYGSDYPFAPTSKPFNAVLDSYPMSEDLRQAINRGNALQLLPRFAN